VTAITAFGRAVHFPAQVTFIIACSVADRIKTPHARREVLSHETAGLREHQHINCVQFNKYQVMRLLAVVYVLLECWHYPCAYADTTCQCWHTAPSCNFCTSTA